MPRVSSGSSSSDPAAQSSSTQHLLNLIKTDGQYDKFLEIVKEGRMKRVGIFNGLNKGTDHHCCDTICSRKWKPSPSQVILDEDYYCPSCVLHHRNNENRFQQDRLKWTNDVPNTFYVFELTDPYNGLKLIKFGRTQNRDAVKRYPTKEIVNYHMQLLLQLRGRLETMTQIENWWKEQADLMGLFTRFSDDDFHGVSECVELTAEQLDDFLGYSIAFAKKDQDEFEEWNKDYDARIKQFLEAIKE